MVKMTTRGMAWANIKHKKAKNDAQKHKLYQKFSREVTVAAAGGADPDMNFALEAVLRRAHKASVPKAVLDRAILLGSGQGSNDGAKFESVLYEGAGPGGSLFMVEALTDNRKRTAPNMRHHFSKHGGQLEANTANYAFERVGFFTIPVSSIAEAEAAEEAAIEAGATDVVAPDAAAFAPATAATSSPDASDEEGEVVEVICEVPDLETVVNGIKAAGLEAHNVELIYDAKLPTSIEDEGHLASFEKLVDALENDDDVSKVFHNVRVSE
ncbi:Translational activator of cytochrome c oxidase 1 [Hondaea fermentalgiana]|uniref:Translational activator of cytochrome c oxidase 1 n=1 Tax=Hondaea fermentalgiana TaxID=2315210 RepID=A0A2R5G8X2_9STRA|nr:Translational activator of cytochrome c oxidase 1 [Hondaea fermentalgiana]|eukprot:GBG24933.1 Translational activator of cytochrome c oxidase 1 [Hondaea fermentalgiana]